MAQSIGRIEILPDPLALARRAAEWMTAAALAAQGPFRVSLSGGSTPKTLYGILAGAHGAQAVGRRRLPWPTRNPHHDDLPRAREQPACRLPGRGPGENLDPDRNRILDCSWGIVGVVESGLFISRAGPVFVGDAAGVDRLESARHHRGGPPILLVMGVSGAGKTAVAKELAARLGWPFEEGDSLRPESNIAKMHAGIPLTDEDRRPWLEAVAAWIDGERAKRQPGIITWLDPEALLSPDHHRRPVGGKVDLSPCQPQPHRRAPRRTPRSFHAREPAAEPTRHPRGAGAGRGSLGRRYRLATGSTGRGDHPAPRRHGARRWVTM
jgi:hypothetical protein